MRKKIFYGELILLFVLFVLISAGLVQAQEKEESLGYIKSNLEYLASDELQGRETGTIGETLSSEFIASELQKYGIKPFGDNGTYYQNFILKAFQYDTTSEARLYAGGKEINLDFGKDFVVDPRYKVTAINLPVEMVFAGYGITAPEYGYDDYSNVDVKNKTVVLLDDEPYSTDTAFFRGGKPTSYSFWGTKVRIALSKGAAGVVILADETTGSAWPDLITWSREESLVLPGAVTESIPVLGINEKTLETILSGEKIEYAEFKKMVSDRAVPPSFALSKSISFHLDLDSKDVNVRNVVGILEGTEVRNEYIAISAHYDHEGIKKGEIYNGADDNGSGTSAILETARRLKNREGSKRSVLFVFHTAEERGLLGSKYLAENAPYVKDIVANINMDMIGREHTDSLHVIGSDRLSTELYGIVEASNKNTVNFNFNYKYNDPADPNRFYQRSDHYNYAKKNIPIVFFFDDMRIDYHKPSDDVEKINFEKIYKVTRLVEDITLSISNLDHRLTVDKTAGN